MNAGTELHGAASSSGRNGSCEPWMVRVLAEAGGDRRSSCLCGKDDAGTQVVWLRSTWL